MAVSQKFMKKQGTEGRGSWVDHLQRLGQVVGQTQAQNPVYSPFPAGTPTLGGNQLIEQARQNAANLALEQAKMNQKVTTPTAPDSKVMRYSLSNASRQIAEEQWNEYLQTKGLQPGQVPPDTQESEQWVNRVMPGLKAGIYDEVVKYGGDTKEAEGMASTIENLLRSRAGLATKPPDQQGQSAEDILEALRSPSQ